MTDISRKKANLSRRAALTGAAATVLAAKMAFPAGAFAQGKLAKAGRGHFVSLAEGFNLNS